MSTRLLLLAALAAALPACGDASEERGVRVVLVSLDTLRADRFDSERMPSLCIAALRGVVWSGAWSATSVTLPSHVSMFSGLHPWRHGVLRNGAVVPDDVPLVAERFRDAGFSTAAVVASFPLERRFGTARGFDDYHDAFTGGAEKTSWNDEEVPDARFSSPADVVTDRALELLDDAPGDRQFLFVHYFDAHAPYGDNGDAPLDLNVLLKAARNRDPSLADELERAQNLYDDDVRVLDAQLGRLLDRLRADEDRFETHVIITADHGESFGEDGSLGHGKRVSPSQVHVPFIVISPRVEAGARRDPVGSVDVAPTLLALAGLPPEPGIDGRDLLAPTPADAAALGMRTLFEPHQKDVRVDGTVLPTDALRFYRATAEGHVAGGTDERWQFTSFGGGAPTGGEDLERHRALFDDLAAEVRARITEMIESADPETRAALEALGYTR